MHELILVAEIGSTTTVVSAFIDLDSEPELLAQGLALTTVEQGDVRVGLCQAVEEVQRELDRKYPGLNARDARMYATSSAAGGLRMTVHGLVYDMTVRAAKEAALGAGAVIKMVTAGKLSQTDLQKVVQSAPNLILLAGGVDYGETETVLFNARALASLQSDAYRLPPVIYAGNQVVREEVTETLARVGVQVYQVDNVYPRLDELNVKPAREVIQRAFEEHITRAPGMDHVRDMVSGRLMPTPGAVMAAAEFFYEQKGDVLVFDVGGATTDVHSVTLGSKEVSDVLIHPEPRAKRTVEGDLGLFRNVKTLLGAVGKAALEQELGCRLDEILETWSPLPANEKAVELARLLTREAVRLALNRHVGRMRSFYGPTGRRRVAEGRDLTAVKWIIGTGGALTRLPDTIRVLETVKAHPGADLLLPGPEAKVLLDRDYIMAAVGVLCREYPVGSTKLLLRSLGSN